MIYKNLFKTIYKKRFTKITSKLLNQKTDQAPSFQDYIIKNLKTENKIEKLTNFQKEIVNELSISQNKNNLIISKKSSGKKTISLINIINKIISKKEKIQKKIQQKNSKKNSENSFSNFLKKTEKCPENNSEKKTTKKGALIISPNLSLNIDLFKKAKKIDKFQILKMTRLSNLIFTSPLVKNMVI